MAKKQKNNSENEEVFANQNANPNPEAKQKGLSDANGLPFSTNEIQPPQNAEQIFNITDENVISELERDLLSAPPLSSTSEEDALRHVDDAFFSSLSGSSSKCKLSYYQRVLLLLILAISLLFVYLVMYWDIGLPDFPSDKPSAGPVATAPASTQPAVRYVSNEELLKPDRIQDRTEPTDIQYPDGENDPLSLHLAQEAYNQQNYMKAAHIYKKMYSALPATKDNELLGDFLKFRIGQSTHRAGYHRSAYEWYENLMQSESPAIRSLSAYHKALLEIQRKEYVRAFKEMYKCIAVIDLVERVGNTNNESEQSWTQILRRDCHYLAAQSLTQHLLTLSDQDKDLPPHLWYIPNFVDPFGKMSESEILDILSKGTHQLQHALLAPRIESLPDNENPIPRWSMLSYQAPLDELLYRFAYNANVDIKWDHETSDTHTVNVVRKRPVTLYLPAATAQQAATIAAGSVGLFAFPSDEGSITIYNPENDESLSHRLTATAQYTISQWQSFAVIYHNDVRSANVHFILGLIYKQDDSPAQALAEFKLLANQFEDSPFAPHALLYSSRIRTSLNDQIGAIKDLQELMDRYPKNSLVDHALFHLAEASRKQELYKDAIKLYEQVYSLALSKEIQLDAALGAAECYHKNFQPKRAIKWLKTYIETCKSDLSNPNYVKAHLLLGQAYLAHSQPKESAQVLEKALTGQIGPNQYLEITKTLVEAYMQQNNPMDALRTLNRAQPWYLPPNKTMEIVLLKSSILRFIGLPEKAISTIGKRADYTTDSSWKAKILAELGKCYIQTSDLDEAKSHLSRALVLFESGPQYNETAIDLAGVCFERKEYAWAKRLCIQVLEANPDATLKQKSNELLSNIYNENKDYDKAALALLGKWNTEEAAK